MEEISMRIGARGKFIDFWSRAVTGPICFESDFDKRVYWPKLKKITEKWGIKYDPDHMVPCDDEMLDRLWQAAIDLVAEVGVLCTDTRRIIEFSRKEILDAAANTADRYTVGVGKDSFTAVHRGFEDYDHVKNPVSVLGRILGPVSQDIYHQIAMSYAQVPQIDMCHFQGNLTEIYGMPITPTLRGKCSPNCGASLRLRTSAARFAVPVSPTAVSAPSPCPLCRPLLIPAGEPIRATSVAA